MINDKCDNSIPTKTYRYQSLVNSQHLVHQLVSQICQRIPAIGKFTLRDDSVRLLKSMSGGPRQRHHTDVHPSQGGNVYSCLLSIMHCTTIVLCINGARNGLKYCIPMGSMLMWSGATGHGGADYQSTNVRIFWKMMNAEGHKHEGEIQSREQSEAFYTVDCEHK